MAQFGRALRSGRKGCGFKSRHLDQKAVENHVFSAAFIISYIHFKSLKDQVILVMSGVVNYIYLCYNHLDKLEFDEGV